MSSLKICLLKIIKNLIQLSKTAEHPRVLKAMWTTPVNHNPDVLPLRKHVPGLNSNYEDLQLSLQISLTEELKKWFHKNVFINFT